MRVRLAAVIALALLIVLPAIVFASTGEVGRMIDLIFTDNDSSITIDETITGTARLRFTHDGTDYVMLVPVTIDVDETLQVANAASATASADRVGVYAVEVVSITERNEEYTLNYSTVAPSEGNKLIGVLFRLTNLSTATQRLGEHVRIDSIVGIDELGRVHEAERVFGCGEVNPGGAVDCLAVYDVESNVNFKSVLVRALDERTLPVPTPAPTATATPTS